MSISIEEFIGYFLPPGSLEYFEIKDFRIKEANEKYMGKYGFDDEYTIILEEKSNLPVIEQLKGKNKIRTKGYSQKRLEDFPIRGRKTTLIYRIRKYVAEGENKVYQRNFTISNQGVSISEEFSFFFETND